MTEPAPPPRTRRKRLRRIALILAVVFVLVPLLVFLSVVLALRSSAARRAVLDRVSSWLRTEYGLLLRAEDFDVRWGGFSLDGVQIGAPDAPPILTASRIEAAVDMGTLRSPVRVIRNLEIDDPRIDLSAPIPKLPESDPQVPPGFEIQRFVLHRGSVLGAPPEPAVSEWLKSWRIDEVEGGGSFLNATWDVSVESAKALVERPGFAPLTLHVGTHLRYPDGQPVEIEWLRATGDGVRLTASGRLGLEEGAPLQAAFDALLDPRLLAAGAPPGGSVRAKGEVRLPESSGKVAIVARNVPAEVLRPYLEPGLFDDLALSGTVADANADVVLGPKSFARARGEGKAQWRRKDRQLLRLNLGVAPGEGAKVRLSAEGDLLPGSSGRRHFKGTVISEGWAELASATAEQVEAELRIPDLRVALAEVRSLWPRLVPEVPENVPVQGALSADLRLSGALTSPQAKMQAQWNPEPGASVRLNAEGNPTTWTGSMRAEVENLSLGLIAPSPPGRGQAPPLQNAAFAGLFSGVISLSGSPRSYRTRLDADIAQASYPPYLNSLEHARITADGALSLRPLLYRGTVDLDGTGLFLQPNASSTAQLASFQLGSDGTFRLEPLSYTGKVSLTGAGLSVPEMVEAEQLTVAADGTFGTALESILGSARLDASGIQILAADAKLLDLHAEARKDGPEVRIASISGSLPEGRTFSASGGFAVEPLLETADLDLRLIRPVDPVREAELTASLRHGVVELSAPKIDTEAGPASLRATVPLGALAQIPELAEALAALSVAPAPGEISVEAEAPSIDSQSLLAALGAEPRAERLRGGASLNLRFDPAAPAAGRGEVRLQGLSLETEDGRVTADGPVVARLGGARLELLPVIFEVESTEIGATAINLKGAADLDPSWKPIDDSPESLVRNVSADAGGTLDAALLNPFLEGGIATGALTFSASASGPLDRLDATFAASGPEASFWWPAAAARIEKPSLLGSWSGESWSMSGEAELNGGSVSFRARPSADEALVSLNLADVPYRFDYGLTTRLGGVLSLHVPLPLTEEARMRLEGTVDVERGVLVRDINLDREVLTLLFAPEDTPGSEGTALDRIDLDLSVTTDEGIRIRNNVADLRARWTRLDVGGTAENPAIRGRVDIDPGGLAYIYGQTARIDRGSLIFTGNPDTDPLVDLVTTSSLDDPTIGQLRGGPLAALDQPAAEGDGDKAGPGIGGQVSAGLAGYYGARVVSRLGEAMGLSRISVRPVLVFGEADPSARLTVGGELSRNASLAISVDLRNAESRTALLDLHGFRGLPGLTVQAFTTDTGGEGASLQQVLDFGGSREAEEKVDRLRRLRLAAPKGISRRALRRAIPLRRKGPVPEEAPFEIEVDLDELLRRRGFPGALVRADAVPVAERPGWVDVNVTVSELGPHVELAFEGDRPPRAFRSEILTAYRTDFYEERSIEEMKAAAVRAFRSDGHPNPQVEIEVRRERPNDPAGPRKVVIRSTAGPRLKLEKLEIAGPAADAARLAAASFPGMLSRAELAAAVPAADRRLLDALRNAGYPEAKIAGREASDSGLVVRVEPGPRQVFGEVEISGVGGEERERLAPLLPIHTGDGFRQDLVSKGQLQMESSLRSRGYADAAVRAIVSPQSGQPQSLNVRYEVEPGPQVRLAKVEFEGERWTRPAQLARLAGLEPGETLDLEAIPEAQSRLFRSGVFSRVSADVDRPREDEAFVTFSLTEKQRFHLGYGVRYESGVGTAAVVDVIDTSFLRRGLTLGLRGLYEPDDSSGRLYLRTGGLFGTGISVETYGFVRRLINRDEEEDLGPLQEDTLESALQFARPFSRRTTGRLYFRYRTTHIFQLEAPLFGPKIDLEIRQPYMGTQVLYDSRNDKVDPTSGVFHSLDLSGSGAFLGGETSYLRLFGHTYFYRTLRIAGRPLVWAQAVRPGVARAFQDEELISEDRFFVGGEFSVRGYDTRSLRAPGRPQEETTLVLNEELRFPLPFDLAGLVFFDAGQVWAGLGDFEGDLAKSLGLGLRAKTPVGLLRLDLAFPLDRRPEDEAYKLYFGFGNAF